MHLPVSLCGNGLHPGRKQSGLFRPENDMTIRQEKLVYLYLFLTFFLWGSLYVASKYVLDKVPPFTVSLVRYAVAFLLLFAFIRIKKYRPIEKKDYKYIFVIGFLGYFVALVLQLLGTKYSSASFASLINSLNPIVIMIMAALLLNEKLTFQKITGLTLGLAGVYAVLGGVHGGDMRAGIALSLVSVLLWSFVSILIRKISHRYPPLLITAWSMGVALACTLPVSAVELARSPVVWDGGVVLALLYMGVMCTCVAHLLWNESLSLVEAGTCSAFYPVQPLSATALGTLLLGESVSLSFWVGTALILMGVMLCLMHGRQSAAQLLRLRHIPHGAKEKR